MPKLCVPRAKILIAALTSLSNLEITNRTVKNSIRQFEFMPAPAFIACLRGVGRVNLNYSLSGPFCLESKKIKEHGLSGQNYHNDYYKNDCRKNHSIDIHGSHTISPLILSDN